MQQECFNSEDAVKSLAESPEIGENNFFYRQNELGTSAGVVLVTKKIKFVTSYVDF